MDNEFGFEMMIAGIPPAGVVSQLRGQMRNSSPLQDIYLAYYQTCGCRLAGYLVTSLGEIDQLTAFCPIPSDLMTAGVLWRREVVRQRSIAIRIASYPSTRRDKESIWLKDIGDGEHEVPTWIFGLKCIPLTYEWDGSLQSPSPFCPRLFESMARQPQAPEWMMQRLNQSNGMR